jgi:hypothetical protein
LNDALESPTTDLENYLDFLISLLKVIPSSFLSFSAYSTNNGFLRSVSSIGLKTSIVNMIGARSFVLKMRDSSATMLSTA